MAVTAGILTNIGEMIDLAIGTPEIGVVDFCMLQTVLHCLAQQLGIKEKNVELRGSIAAFPVGRQTEECQTIAVDEYLLETDGKPAENAEEQDTLLIVQRVKKGDEASTKLAGKQLRTPGHTKTGSPRGAPHRDISDSTKGTVDGGSGAPGGVVSGSAAAVPDGATGRATGGGSGSASGEATGGAAGGTFHAASGEVPSGVPGGIASGGPGGVQSEVTGGVTGVTPSGAPIGVPGAAPGGASSGAPAVALGGPSATGGATGSRHEENPAVGRKTSAGALVPRMISSSEKISLVTISKFNILESTVADLKNRVYGSMPKNEEILQEVRSQTNLKAITDMWTSLNVSSRLEAAEEGIGKLSSLVQDIIAESRVASGQQETTSSSKERVLGTPPTAQTVTSIGVKSNEPVQQTAESQDKSPSQQQTDSGAPSATLAPPAPSKSKAHSTGAKTPSGSSAVAPSSATVPFELDALATKEDLSKLIGYLNNLRNDHERLCDAFYAAIRELNIKSDRPPPSALPPPTSVIFPLASGVDSSGADSSIQQKIAILSNKLQDLENKLLQCYETVFAPGAALQDQINSLQDQVEHHLRYATEPSDGTKLSPDLAKDLQGLVQLFQTVQDMQVQLQQVHETAVQLASEKEDRQQNINSLLEQIELLKAIKLDREDMAEALADKVDLRMLARKVSHDQFEMACDDLSRGLEHALGKLNVQESLWQQALDDIQREIETKLDKLELSPVKDFFNNKLKQLQENLKQMAALRREAEAAGTKRRLLTNVNCISCDAKAVMSMEPPAPATSNKGLPPSMSMKPYLSYELDAIRKTQASSLPQRNMHDWERIDKQASAPKQPQKVRSETDKHLCNRYCGGSHTTTTPAQRVTRLGHFIKQWGPEVLPLSSGFATGDDGRLYKITLTEAANVGPGGAVDVPCTPKSIKKYESKPASQKPLPAECRCLDGT